MLPPLSPASLRPAQTRLSTPSQLRFSGDAFLIRKKYLSEAAKPAKAEFAIAESAKHTLKTICETVVWQKDGETLNVAEMIAFLCRKRSNDGYPGFGTVETLAKDFPGMNIEVLKQSFDKLRENGYLGKAFQSGVYWLRPMGEEMIQKLYPDITLPPEEERFTKLILINAIGGDITLPPEEERFTESRRFRGI